MFFQLSKFNCVSESNQTSNQNFPTPFFREKCQEDIAILIVFSRTNLTGNERLCSIEFDYVRFLNCSITERSIAFDWQNFFEFDFKSSITEPNRAIGFDWVRLPNVPLTPSG